MEEPGAYIPFVDVRTILTGFSSRISSIKRLPEKAAVWASAVRERDDDLGSRSPPRSDWPAIRPPARLPTALSRRTVLVVSTDEVLTLFAIDLESNNLIEERFASLATIPFVMNISFIAVSSSNHECMSTVARASTEGCNHLSCT